MKLGSRYTLRALFRDLLYSIFDRPLKAPSSGDLAMIELLKDRFGSIHSDIGVDGSSPEWRENVRRLTAHVLNADVRSFLKWDVIRETMFFENRGVARKELLHLLHRTDWLSRWMWAVAEDRVGRPTPLPFYPWSSGNRIHHAYHLAILEQCVGLRVNEFDLILEIGGGYGSMCRLAHRLGFRGGYGILDLSPFSALQEYYLRSLGTRVRLGHECDGGAGAVCCMSDIGDAHAFCERHGLARGRKLAIALWSLSETPPEFRRAVVGIVRGADYCLFGYQENFSGIDNLAWFDAFIGENLEFEWKHWEIEHLPKNRYLIGIKKR